jgi:hypothetical protein
MRGEPMRKILITITLALLVLPLATKVCLCGDGSTIMISCTIPAIPGVNAPLIEENARINAPVNSDFKVEKTDQQALSMIQQDAQIQKNIADKNNSSLLLKTIYSR